MINLIYKDGRGHKMARPVTSREEYVALRNTPENAKCFYDARGGQQAAKLKQVQFNYNDLLPDGVLKGCCHPASTFAHDIDCQSAEEQAAIKQRILEKKDEIGLLELSGSANFGLHAVCRREKGKTILESQVKVGMVTQTEMDTNTHDQARVMFTGPATDDNLFYLDDAIFEEDMSIEESAAEFEVLKEREKKGLEEVPAEAKKAIKHFKPWEISQKGQIPADAPTRSLSSLCESAPNQHNSTTAPADERVRYIAEGVMKEKGLEKSDFLNEGGRHTTVKVFLSGATQLLTKEEANGILAELMPDHWKDENIQSLVEAFYANYYNPTQRLPKWQETLFTGSQHLKSYGDQTADTPAVLSPPPMPKKMPKLIELLTSRSPEIYKPAVANAAFPPLGTHLCDVRFCYTDNVEHEATLMNCLMAGTGAGKGCIDEPINHIMADIKRRDEENTRREDAWKKDCQKKGANKDKMMRPEGLVIQQIDPDMTKPALVTRMDEAEGHFVYVKLNELDLFEQLKGQTGKQHFQLMCLAFDPGAEYGQTRVGTQSVTARPKCRFNWNACTTIQKGRRFFSRVLTDGPISRINFCTIPEVEIGAEQPIYGKYDAEFDEQLKPYIDNLTKPTPEA